MSKPKAKTIELHELAYAAIKDFIHEYRISPTIREIAARVPCSVSGASKAVLQLEAQGKIKRTYYTHRGIVVL